MMRKFLFIMLSFTLYLAWGVSHIALTERANIDGSTHEAYACGQSTTDEGNIASAQFFISSYATPPTLGNARSSTVYTSTTKAQQSHQRNTMRQRIESEKLMSAAIHSRHSGHTTHIFEYNHFRSSLRVAYYLHTLCRLRI